MQHKLYRVRVAVILQVKLLLTTLILNAVDLLVWVQKMSLQICKMQAFQSSNTAANLVCNVFWEGRLGWRRSSLTDNTTDTSNSWSIKAASTPWGPVSQAGGGSWRASWRRRDPGLGCIAAQRRSRLSGTAGGRPPEGCTGAGTSHTPASARAQSTPAPSAPGWPKWRKGECARLNVRLETVGERRCSRHLMHCLCVKRKYR